MQLRARSTLREGSGTINLYWLMLATWNIRSYIRNKEKEEREKATGCVCLSCWPSCGSSDTRQFRFGSASNPKTPIGSWDCLFHFPFLTMKRAMLHKLTREHDG